MVTCNQKVLLASAFMARCVSETKREPFMESHISQVFFISNLQPHGVKQQHLYVQSIGNLLGLMMIVRHIFIKFLIGFALNLHKPKII